MTDRIQRSVASERTTDGPGVDALLERVVGCARDVSSGFERWDDPVARGPGLYFVVARDATTDRVAPMGTNRWPVEDCANVLADADAFLETAREVAVSCDGAVVVHTDGTIEEAMVRVEQLSPTERERLADLPFAGWMGARHMSALECSTREEVVATVTLSEEDGRVTVFTNGRVDDSRPTALETE